MNWSPLTNSIKKNYHFTVLLTTNKFIKTPYLKNSIFNGLVSIIISIILFLIITLTINKNLNIFYNESLLNIITFTCVFIIIIGILINYMSTLIITNNNLKKIN